MAFREVRPRVSSSARGLTNPPRGASPRVRGFASHGIGVPLAFTFAVFPVLAYQSVRRLTVVTIPLDGPLAPVR